MNSSRGFLATMPNGDMHKVELMTGAVVWDVSVHGGSCWSFRAPEPALKVYEELQNGYTRLGADIFHLTELRG